MSRHIPTLTFAAGLILGGSVYACAGDDPVDTSALGDAGSSGTSSGTSGGGTSSSGDAGSSSGEATCAGQTFELTPLAPPAFGGSPVWITEMLRISAGQLYFSAKTAVGGPADIYRAPWTSGSPPTIGAPMKVQSDARYTDDNGSTWATPARGVNATDEGGFMLFVNASGTDDNKFYWAQKLDSGPPFSDGTFFSELYSADNNDLSPWLVGAPSNKMYFARRVGSTAYRVVVGGITPRVGDSPEVTSPVEVPVACPDATTKSCAAPVVTLDERTLLFTTFAFPKVEPNVYESWEARLDADGRGDPVKRTEVGNRYPSWISDDGCEAIFGNAAGENVYARRSKK